MLEEKVVLQQSDQPALKSLRLSKKLLFAMLSIVLLLLALEGTGRLAGYPTGAVRRIGHVSSMDPEAWQTSYGMWRPGFKGEISWPIEIAYNVTINKLGFRGPEFSLEKPPGVFRILCLGDSTTFSVHVNDDQTYPFQLQKILNENFKTLEVINAGVPNWGTNDQLRFLKERAIQVKPDLIIHLFCNNDPKDIGTDIDADRGHYVNRARQAQLDVPLLEKLRFGTALGEFEMRLRANILKHRKERQRKQDVAPWDILPNEQQWAIYEQVYKKLVDYCQTQSVPLITVSFPAFVSLRSEDSAHEPKLRDITEKQGIAYLSVLEAFRASEQAQEATTLLPIDPHANAKGNAIIAREIALFLAKHQLGPYSVSPKKQ